MVTALPNYEDLLKRVQRTTCRAVPDDATVAVVSKGDARLLELDGRRGWHFPQRADGVYAGYYPADSASAIDHVEALRQKGAEFLVFPVFTLWWLDYYPELTEHLQSRYRVLVRDLETCVIFVLFDPGARPGQGECFVYEGDLDTRIQAGPDGRQAAQLLDGPFASDIRTLFDASHYSEQVGTAFASLEEALDHYLRPDFHRKYNPHPLFDTKWYLDRNPAVRALRLNPLLHFLEHCVDEGTDPNPYFDTEYYYSQGETLREHRINALAHYVAHAAHNSAYNPNPIFGDGFYLGIYRDVQESEANPLAHYLGSGWREGRVVSHIHHNMLEDLRRSSLSSCLRGNWKSGTVLFALAGDGLDDEWLISQVARRLAEDHHLDSLVVAMRHPKLGPREIPVKRLVLEDYRIASDVLRPSALRLFMKSMASARPLFSVVTRPDLLEALELSGIPAYFAVSKDHIALAPRLLEHVLPKAHRAIFPSTDLFHQLAARIGRYPANVALLHRNTARLGSAGQAGETPQAASETADPHDQSQAQSLIELARSDFDLRLGVSRSAPLPLSVRSRKILIPCSDWSVSGVNASLEAIGQELIRLGWEVEIVFTRNKTFVLESVHDEAHLPKIPFRFLERPTPGLQGMWEALIADVEEQAPCIAFTAYDFLANGCIPAFTDRVGAVLWVQADDGDYYEQAYRLGRYCNAVVCVSQRLKDNVMALNPLIGERSEVIHNSSVWADDVVSRRRRPGETLRLIYTGRLVHYQKRVLDYVELAASLDAVGVPYEMTLIGAFSSRGGVMDDFHTRARSHIADGRIRLVGRKARQEVLKELTEHDFFVLLSDFEGFPLALVEAMARGCVPVVAETDSGIPELLVSGQNGLVVIGRDYEKWAYLIAEVWREPSRLSRLSKSARATVRKRFTVEQTAKRFDSLFTEVGKELASGAYERPPSLHWGDARSPAGDALPPPSLYRPVNIAGLE